MGKKPVVLLIRDGWGYREENCVYYTCVSSLSHILNGLLYTVAWAGIILLVWALYWNTHYRQRK